MAFIDRLLELRRSRRYGGLAGRLLQHHYGVAIPRSVSIGRSLVLPHTGRGTVIHPDTAIGDYVTIYHGVTIGRLDSHIPPSLSAFRGITIGDHAVLCTGSVVLGGPGVTTVAPGTLLGANSVLRESTGPWEVWAGIPARRVGMRKDRPPQGA